MRTLYLILGVLLVLVGLLLLIVNSVIGIITIAFGVVMIVKRKKLLRDEETGKWRWNVPVKEDEATLPPKKEESAHFKKTISAPEAVGEYRMKYHYRGEKIAMPNIENCMEVVESTTRLSFESEPNNEHDSKAIKIVADGMFLGYVHRGRTQDMIHDFNRRNEPVYAILETVSEETGEAYMFIAFYRNPFEQYASCDKLTTKLIKTSKKISEWENRQDNYLGVERGDTLDLDYDYDTETYTVLDNVGSELGEISKSISAKIQEREDMDEPICIVDEVTIDDNDKYGAKVIIYFK